MVKKQCFIIVVITLQVIAECDDSFAMEHTPEMDRAAVKIQASYKGYKTRKELHKI